MSPSVFSTSMTSGSFSAGNSRWTNGRHRGMGSDREAENLDIDVRAPRYRDQWSICRATTFGPPTVRSPPGRLRIRVITDGSHPACASTTQHRDQAVLQLGRAQRTDTTIKDPGDLDIRKRLRHRSELREIGFSANRRLLGVQRLSRKLSRILQPRPGPAHRPRSTAPSCFRTPPTTTSAPQIDSARKPGMLREPELDSITPTSSAQSPPVGRHLYRAPRTSTWPCRSRRRVAVCRPEPAPGKVQCG
jgi:hypothetical protein